MRRPKTAFALAVWGFLLLTAWPLWAQKWDKNYERRPQEIIAELSRLNGLTGWPANTPAHWPALTAAASAAALKKPVGGVQWDSASGPPYPLTKLVIANHNLKRAADLSGLGRLEELEIYGNQLQGLNLAGNHSLTVLLAMNNQLAALDLSACPNLARLSLANNKLGRLDLSANARLTLLDLSSNEIESLSLKANPELSQLNLTNNRLTAINVAALADLRQLGLAHNEIEELDLKNNPALTELRAGHNRLAALDLRNNPALAELSVSRNRLSELDLKANPALTRFSAGRNELKSLDLSRCPNLQAIDLEDNPLTEIILGDNPLAALESLNLDGCRLPLSRLWPLSGKAKRRGRLGHQRQVLFEERSLRQGEALDLSSEEGLGGAPTTFTVLTEKKRRVKKDDYTADGGLIVFKFPGRYIVEMSNPNVVTTEAGASEAKNRSFKIKAYTGLIEVLPPLEDKP